MHRNLISAQHSEVRISFDKRNVVRSTCRPVLRNTAVSAVHERAVAPCGNTGKSGFNRDRQKAIVGIEENNMTRTYLKIPNCCRSAINEE